MNDNLPDSATSPDIDNNGEKDAKTTLLSQSEYVFKHPFTDAGNAKRFAAQHSACLRYSERSKQWYVFNGTYWIPDVTPILLRR